MDEKRKDANIQIGKRLREAGNNLGHTQAELQHCLERQRSIIVNMNQVQRGFLLINFDSI